jgi:hypothetical protein
MKSERSRNDVEPMGSRWYPFRNWCAAKGFTPQHGYNLIARGELETVVSGRRRFVTEEQDRRFDDRCISKGEAA